MFFTVNFVQSYKHIPVWLMEAKRHIEPHQATFLMVGCKKDLARTEREVPKETAQVDTKPFCEISDEKKTSFRPWQITMEFLSWRLLQKPERMLRRLSPKSARPSMTR